MSESVEQLGDNYEAVIGLEVHCQLMTDSKLFSGASAAFGAPPNTEVSPVDMGLPGVLPVVNRRAVEFAMKAGIAVGADINRESRFARKQYFYPDLPKGYQISQHRTPLCEDGVLAIEVEDEETGERETREIGIERIHMEEDAGKSKHLEDRPHSLVDLNRCGVPLIEIVSKPDLRTPAEARAYMKELRDIVVYLGINDGDMSQGSLRCDANVSVRPKGQEAFGTRTELKNINSFKFVHDGLAYEIERQIALLEDGGEVVQETRLYDPGRGETFSMRSKEESHDYRYFPEPDLPVLSVDEAWIEAVEGTLPELPAAKRQRYRRELGLGAEDARVLTSELPLARFFEEAVELWEAKSEGDSELDKQAQQIANWVVNEWLRALNDAGLSITDVDVTAADFVRVVELVDEETISQNSGKEVLGAMIETGDDPDAIVEERGLEQMSDTGELEGIVEGIVEDNPEQTEQYRDGNHNVIGWFIGQVMQATQGSANPKVAREILLEKLEQP